DYRVLAGFDHLIQVTQRAAAHCASERAVLPVCAVMTNQEASDEIVRGEVVVARNRDQRASELPRHVFHEARLAAAGRPFEHDGQAARVTLFEDPRLLAAGHVVRRRSGGVGRNRACGFGAHAVGLRGESAPESAPAKDGYARAASGCATGAPSFTTSRRGPVRKKSQMNSATPTAKTAAVAISMRKCTWIFSCVSR